MISIPHSSDRRPACLALVLSALLAPAADSRPAAGETGRPNVVVVFVDDMGYGDVGAFGGSRWSTPNLDRMADQGMRLTDFYVAQPVCSASRAALLTGCYPNRIGIAGALGPGARHGLAEEETTLAELCRSRGYRTAIYGKWHLGHRDPFLPTRHGFDEYLGIPYSNDMWPLHPDYVSFPPATANRKRGYPDLPLYEDERIVDPLITPEDQSRFTRQFTERAVEFIERDDDRPFFLYVAHPMPHVPLYVSEDFDGRSGVGRYGDVIEEIDWSVGRILDAVRRRGVDDSTLVIFTSDNGPWLSYGNHAGTAGVLREGKGTTFEGGVRVPFIARWPGMIPAGAVCRTPLMTIDVLPTVATFIGAAPPAGIDGRDAAGVLLGRTERSPQEAYFFYYHRNDLEAMRCGRWKLHFPHGFRSMEGREPGREGMPGKYDHSRRTGLELYDLEADPGETIDVAARHPEVVARLQRLADGMRRQLGDKLTEVAPTAVRPAGRLPAEDAGE